VLSTGIPSLSASQAAGELPDVDVLPGQEGVSNDDEGTAMLEIVHDIAPNAALGFATALGGDPSSPPTSARCASRPAATSSSTTSSTSTRARSRTGSSPAR
jgi:hypothetical protein